jgi:protoheme IX farnesyltransferase
MNSPLEQADSGSGGAAAARMPVSISPWSLVLRRAADYAELSKLRISALVLLVTAVGFCLGSASGIDVLKLVNVLFGTAMVAIGANTLNQYIERDYDRLMHRTRNRPVPSQRLSASEALMFGVASSLIGLAYLLLRVNPLSALLAGATLLLYVGVYTPLKRVTVWNTIVGAIPGALPPVIGFAGAANRTDGLAWMLFAIVFIWQMPHFFAIAWIYREDYSRGGYKMLSVVDPSGTATGRHTIAYSVVLIGTSLLPYVSGYASISYVAPASMMGIALLIVGVRMAGLRTAASARTMLLASVIYLPAIMLLLLLTHISQ